MSANPPFLYHYTSIQALYSILDNLIMKVPEEAGQNSIDYYHFCLWGSHVAYMNDPTENQFFTEALRKALSIYEENKGLSSKSPFIQQICNFFDCGEQPYVVSFCEEEKALSMWRSYGANACGAAICFSYEKMKEYLSQEKDVWLYKIIYANESDLVSSFKDEQLKEIWGKINIAPSINGYNKGIGFKLDLSGIFSNKKFYKHKAYQDEKEWRLVSMQIKQSGFTVRNGLIVPYYKFVLPLKLIDRIIIGPCAEQTLNQQSIELLLKTKLQGINKSDIFSIEKSELPYVIR